MDIGRPRYSLSNIVRGFVQGLGLLEQVVSGR